VAGEGYFKGHEEVEERMSGELLLFGILQLQVHIRPCACSLIKETYEYVFDFGLAGL
jgi:hypothetical protein